MKEAIVNRIEQDATVKKPKLVYNKENTTRQNNKGTWSQLEIVDWMQASWSNMEETIDN